MYTPTETISILAHILVRLLCNVSNLTVNLHNLKFEMYKHLHNNYAEFLKKYSFTIAQSTFTFVYDQKLCTSMYKETF
jgi:hypothetical protein